MNARRISIVGATGAGKSFLARQLSDRLSLPHVELDRLRRSADGVEANPKDFQRAVLAQSARDAWIIDGHYRDVRNIIWDRAEVIVWLNYSMALVGKRLLSRYLDKRRGRAGGQAEAGFEGTISHSEASWRRRCGRLVRTFRERGEYRRLLGKRASASATVIELNSPAATEAWLQSLHQGAE